MNVDYAFVSKLKEHYYPKYYECNHSEVKEYFSNILREYTYALCDAMESEETYSQAVFWYDLYMTTKMLEDSLRQFKDTSSYYGLILMRVCSMYDALNALKSYGSDDDFGAFNTELSSYTQDVVKGASAYGYTNDLIVLIPSILFNKHVNDIKSFVNPYTWNEPIRDYMFSLYKSSLSYEIEPSALDLRLPT